MTPWSADRNIVISQIRNPWFFSIAGYGILVRREIGVEHDNRRVGSAALTTNCGVMKRGIVAQLPNMLRPSSPDDPLRPTL